MSNSQNPSRALHQSMIDRTVRDALVIFQAAGFHLPPFSRWTPTQWREAGTEWDSARHARLGWDVTDFGLGNFSKVGRVLFTLRNGISKNDNKPYAEKIILGRQGQRAPAHYHKTKIEDIINRGGGEVVLRLDPPVKSSALGVIYKDGKEIFVTPGLEIRLAPGESLCIPPGVIHQFWGDETETGKIPLIGEVSSFCDDVNDNVFFDEVARFASIVEDQPAEFTLCHEIPVSGLSQDTRLPKKAKTAVLQETAS